MKKTGTLQLNIMSLSTSVYIGFIRYIRCSARLPVFVTLVSAIFISQSFSLSHAESAPVKIGTSRIYKNIQSVQDIKKKGVVMQDADYSCGAASLATIMKYYFGDDISEKSILETAKRVLGKNEVELKEKGLSLLDLKGIAEHYGYQAAGFRMSINNLRQLKGPIIIFFKPFGYEHFAVLKGVKGNRVYIADPSRGNYRDVIYRFKNEWNGLTLVLDKSSSLNDDSILALRSTDIEQPERLSIQRMMQAGDIGSSKNFNYLSY